MSEIDVRLDDLGGPEIAGLLADHLASMHEHSPPGSVHALDLSALTAPEVTFWSAWIDGELAGCGALKELSPTSGEVKSMRTAPGHLRRGVAAAVLSEIVTTARERGYTELLLETGHGPAFDAAHALYERFGFEPCGPFGDYTDDEFSRYLCLPLTTSERQLSEADAEVMRFIAEGVTELAGFATAGVSIVHDGVLVTVATIGDDATRAAVEALRTPVRVLLDELARGEQLGTLSFVPFERQSGRLDGHVFTADGPVHPDDPGAWHPQDLLCALLHDEEGTLRGVLSVDQPRSGRRPDADQRRIIEVYARQAGRAVVTALERAELEVGLRREQAVAEHRGRLIDVLSHQLQNPVAAISGNVELLLDDLVPGDPSERSLRAIDRATRRIVVMVGDLLALARVNNPSRALAAVEVDLAEVVREAVDLLAAEAERRDVRVDVHAPAPAYVVEGDRVELDHLVANLVSNAVKYSWPGTSVSVSLEDAELRGRPAVALVVRDRGIGIAPEDRDRLFEEFYRSGSSEVRSRPGTGLGLAIVDRVVRRHGGRIEVESEPAAGATFVVRIPRTLLK